MSGQGVAPRLTVLIVSWNAWHHLVPCLESILASSYRDLEILVIDNASVDATVEQLPRHFPQVRFVQNDRNLGHTLAVNQGFRLARGESILVLDADTESAPDALAHLVGFLDSNPDVDVLAPRTFNTDGTIQESARNFPNLWSGIFGRQSLLTRVFPNNPFSRKYLMREALDKTHPFRVESVASSCMLVRRSLIERVGAWDEGYPGYFVETDWCYRLKLAGVKVFCVPAARVVHHEGNNRRRKRSVSRIVMFHRGAFRFYRRNRTLGWADPRAMFALVALTARAGLLIAANSLKPATGTEAPRTQRTENKDMAV
ncbi:glycosyltransferase family 2 protein [soil metagenome]